MVWKMSASGIFSMSPRIVAACAPAVAAPSFWAPPTEDSSRNSTSSLFRISFWLVVMSQHAVPLRSPLRATPWSAAFVIGTALLLAQRAPAQISGVDVGVVPDDNAQFRRQFAQLLLESRTRDLVGGFELARSLGPPVAPLLWNMHAAEKSDARRRITMLAAAILAEGAVGDEHVLAALDRDRTQPRDRLLTCLLLALGPERTREQPAFWEKVYGRNRQEPTQLLQVVALLASARFPGAAAAAPPTSLRDPDPGVVAAGVFAGAPVADATVQTFWRKDPPAHAQLVWRATFLAELQRGDPAAEVDAALLQSARRVVAMPGEVYAAARATAALLLGRARAFDRDVRPDWRLLQLIAADSRAAGAVQQWLTAAPQLLAEDPAQARLAVEYVLSRTTETVLADSSAWSGERSIKRDVAIALAWRLCGETAPKPVEWPVTGLPEWFFVRWASGARVSKEASIEDPALEQAAKLCADGRMPRDAMQRILEEALWRWGSHPGLGLWQAEREFVRDLVLSGSVPGNRYLIGLPDHLRYVPGGLRHEDDFFDVGVELYEFLSRRVPPVPAECHLR